MARTRKGFEMSLRLVIGIVVLIVVGLVVITIVSSYLMKTADQSSQQNNQTLGQVNLETLRAQCRALNITGPVTGKWAGDYSCCYLLGYTSDPTDDSSC